jgi:glycogen synthase kinase 3 beta
MIDSLPATFRQRVRAIRHEPNSINDESAVEISLLIDRRRPIGKGTFATVYKCYIDNADETVALKEVLIDRTHKNRELEILRELNHPNIVQLKYYFVREDRKREFSCLMMELLPETVHSLLKRCFTNGNDRRSLDVHQIKFYTFQLFRALAYLHTLGIAHRDIKPSNLLVDSRDGLLKLCDFGAAKHLVPNDTSVSYMCSRYYRAPELILGSTSYTTSIDVWSAACVLTEFYSGVPLFKGRSSATHKRSDSYVFCALISLRF